MKKLLIQLLVLCFFIAACNNNKTGKNKNSINLEKDDYGKSGNLNNYDEKKNEDKSGNNVNTDNNKMVSSWPQAERDAFITNCIKEAMADGSISRAVAQNYCDCMLKKMETLYPDINDLANFTEEDFETPAMKKMATDCLKEN